ncbi:MAG: hypothetical protein FVQ84_00655 [Planctomycetes bacterium]|nr:hypothetical protein [Planctomycetota bacterium]
MGNVRLEDFARCCFDEDRAVEAARFLAERDLLKLDTINHPSGYIKLGFTSGGYDLGKKYNSKIGTLGIWVTEYLWFFVVLSVVIGIIGVLTTIIIAIIKD